MAEYINTTTLLKEIDHAFHADTIGKKDVINLIINLPTADVAEVVRCRDCKFRSSWMMNRNLRYICPESGMFPNCENDFCSRGKGKEEDNNG